MSGFTMLEIIAVLVIIGVLAAVAVSKVINTQGVSAVVEADILKSHLRYVHMRALSDAATWGMSFSGTSYTMLRDGAEAPYNLPNEDSHTHQLPSGVTVSEATTVTFDEWGTPVDESGSPEVGNITISVSAGGETVSVTVTQNTGFIP